MRVCLIFRLFNVNHLLQAVALQHEDDCPGKSGYEWCGGDPRLCCPNDFPVCCSYQSFCCPNDFTCCGAYCCGGYNNATTIGPTRVSAITAVTAKELKFVYISSPTLTSHTSSGAKLTLGTVLHILAFQICGTSLRRLLSGLQIQQLPDQRHHQQHQQQHQQQQHHQRLSQYHKQQAVVNISYLLP